MPPKSRSAFTLVGWLTKTIPVEIFFATSRPVGRIGGEHRAAETEGRIVGDPDRIILVLRAEQHRDRSEELPIAGGIVLTDIGQDRRLHERALIGHRGPTSSAFAPSLDRLADHVLESRRRPPFEESGPASSGIERVARHEAGHALACSGRGTGHRPDRR